MFEPKELPYLLKGAAASANFVSRGRLCRKPEVVAWAYFEALQQPRPVQRKHRDPGPKKTGCQTKSAAPLETLIRPPHYTS